MNNSTYQKNQTTRYEKIDNSILNKDDAELMGCINEAVEIAKAGVLNGESAFEEISRCHSQYHPGSSYGPRYFAALYPWDNARNLFITANSINNQVISMIKGCREQKAQEVLLNKNKIIETFHSMYDKKLNDLVSTGKIYLESVDKISITSDAIMAKFPDIKFYCSVFFGKKKILYRIIFKDIQFYVDSDKNLYTYSDNMLNNY